MAWDNELLRERLTELELALDSQGWEVLTGASEHEFSREGLRKICRDARLYYLKNPLIRRGVDVQADYVFGQGVEIASSDEECNQIIQEFLDDAKNQAELTSHQAMAMKGAELTLFGNIFFALFTRNGRVRVRTIPVDEIDDIIVNPEDAKDPWWYRRTYQIRDLSGTSRSRTVYYRDWRYASSEKPDGEIAPAVVFHMKTGGLPDMRFGVSETYAAHDWAKAYKSFLEDWASITRAYARFAWNVSVKTPQGIANAKAKLNTTLGTSSSIEMNPPPIAGSTFIGTSDVGIQPIRTAGATTSAEDGRRLLLMVASVFGLPESFFGDVSIGTLATAKSLDRPTELKFTNRRALWADALQDICEYVLVQAARAGRLDATIIEDEDGTPTLILPPGKDERTGETIERTPSVSVTFPPILEHSILDQIDAIVKSATLGAGGALAGVIDAESVSRMLLTALGEQDIDEHLARIYPRDDDSTAAQSAPPEETAEALLDAVRNFRQEIEHVVLGGK